MRGNAMTAAAALAMAMTLVACGGGSQTSPGSTASAVVAVTASPNPIAGGPCTGCGAGSTDREAKTTVTIRESGGVAGTVTSMAMVLRADAGGAILAEGTFDATAVASLAGTARISANGSLDVPCSVHYAANLGGQAATLTCTATFTDDHSHALVRPVAVPVNGT